MVTYGGFREFGGPRGWLAGLEEGLTADKGRHSLSFFSFPFSFFSFPLSFLFQPEENKREKKEKRQERKERDRKRKERDRKRKEKNSIESGALPESNPHSAGEKSIALP